MARRSGDFALAGVAVVLHADPGDGPVCTAARIVAFGAGPGPLRLGAAEALVVGRPPRADRAREAGAAAAAGCDPEDDVHASAAYRRHLVGVLTEQALRDAAARLPRDQGERATPGARRPARDPAGSVTSHASALGPSGALLAQPEPTGAGGESARAVRPEAGGGGTVAVRLVVNGQAVARSIAPRRSLADVLREDLGLTGTHVGCEHGVCGACTVLVDGRTARSCLLLAVPLEGAHVTTIEGLTPAAGLSPLQQAFRDGHALQCGFCTPGMLAAAHELLGGNPAPTREEIREALGGNLCMCTGYVNIVTAVERAAALLRGETVLDAPPGPHREAGR